MTKIAVIIPFFQRQPGLLRRAVVSVLNQKRLYIFSVEIIIVDDGSPIKASDEIRGIAIEIPFQITLLEQDNCGVAKSRNAALKAVSDDVNYIAFLDSDDVWDHEHLYIAISALKKGSDFYFCDSKRSNIESTCFESMGMYSFKKYLRLIGADKGNLFFLSPIFLFEQSLRARPYHTSTVVYRKSIADNLRFDEDLKFAGEDSLFFCQLIDSSEICSCCDKVLVNCGDGISLFSGNFDWDGPNHILQIVDQIVSLCKIKGSTKISSRAVVILNGRLSNYRLIFCYLTARAFLKKNIAVSNLISKVARSDKSIVLWYPIKILLSTLIYFGKLIGYKYDFRYKVGNFRKLNVLIVTTAPYFPQHYSGANSSVEQLGKSLKERGHGVSVLAALGPGGWFCLLSTFKAQIGKQLYGYKVSADTVRGYKVWRAWFPWEVIDRVVSREKPDVIVIAAGKVVRMALAAKGTGTPICMSLTDVEFDQHEGDFRALGRVNSVANSQFTAGRYGAKSGIVAKTIFPLVDFERYTVVSTCENVTFINPHASKGLGVALELAKHCPEIPFAFYRSWILNEEQERELAEAVNGLPNVTVFEAQSDMRTVYGKCKVLLVPSLWEEAYGRVVTEAQVSGIPVVASTRGGLPEAVGPGGVLLDPEGPIELWADELRALWSDRDYYDQMSKAASAYARRPENTLACKVDMWEQILTLTADGRSINEIGG